jgi:hypothetical protein
MVRSIARRAINSEGWRYEVEAKVQPDGSVRITYVVPKTDEMARSYQDAEEAEAKIEAWKEEVI